MQAGLPHLRAAIPNSVATVPRYFPPLWVFKQHWASFCLSGAPLESHDPTGLFLLVPHARPASWSSWDRLPPHTQSCTARLPFYNERLLAALLWPGQNRVSARRPPHSALLSGLTYVCPTSLCWKLWPQGTARPRDEAGPACPSAPLLVPHSRPSPSRFQHCRPVRSPRRTRHLPGSTPHHTPS